MDDAPMTTETKAPIAVENVSYAFGKGVLRKQILFDVSTEVAAGEIVILTGPSGSGKTTLLTLIGALRSAQEGSVKILGQELKGAKEKDLVQIRRQIGYIFQSHNLLDSLSVEQNVRMALQLGRKRSELSNAESLARIQEVLGRVGLEDHLHKRIGQLSGGQRQRVAIARALVNKPAIILADEPTASLDKQSGRDVVDRIQQLAREEGASVVLVTHDNRILDVADRILNLEDGRVQSLSEAVAGEAGRMLEILSQYDPEAHHQLIAFALAMARVAQADRNVAPEEVEVIRGALSEVADLGEGEIDFVMHLVLSHAGSVNQAGAGHLRSLTGEQRKRLTNALHAVGEADGELIPDEREEIDRIIQEMSVEP
jgi:putative ABC transport system ATP-binding protein